MVLVQRQPKAQRYIENLHEVLAYLAMYKVSVLVIYLEQISVLSQYYL